jgi:hypothetical protein
MREANLPSKGAYMPTSPTGHRPPELVDRRTFNAAFVRALLAAGFVSRCGSSPTSPTSPATPNPTTPPGSVTGAVSANHPQPHLAIITASQLAAAAPIVVDITNGMHTHTVTLTGAEVAQIAAGMRVQITSSTNTHSDGTGPHNHVVTFN